MNLLSGSVAPRAPKVGTDYQLLRKRACELQFFATLATFSSLCPLISISFHGLAVGEMASA